MTEMQQPQQALIRADTDAVFSKLSELVETREVGVDTLVSITMSAMRLVQDVAAQSGDGGAAKKAIVLQVLRRLVESRIGDEGAREAVLYAIDTMLPSVIDGLVEADHTQFLNLSRGVWARIKTGCARLATCCRT